MKKFFKNFNILGMIMLGLCVLLGVGDVAGAVFADGVALNPAGTGATVGSPEGNGGVAPSQVREFTVGGVFNPNIADLIKDPIDQKIVQIRPYANPIDTLLRYANAENINNLEFGYYSIGTRPVVDKTQGAATITSNANKKNVKGELTVTDISLFEVTDTAFVTGTYTKSGESTPTTVDLQLYVYEKDASNNKIKFTVAEDQMVESGSAWTIPAIAANTDIYLMARAASEKDVTSPAMSVLPEKKIGYCQIFMAEIEQNTYQQMADKEVKWDLTEVEENVLFEYRRRMEGTWLRGRQSKIWDPIKQMYIYQAGGLLSQIKKTHTVNTANADGNAEIVDLAKAVFKGNNGAKVRYAICGSEAMAKISKLKGVERKQDAVQTEVVYGITWSKMVTNFGQINMVLHEQLDEYGLSDKMIIVDPQFLKMKRVKGFERNVVDGREILKTNGDIVVFSEACGLAVYNPDTHLIATVA